jgi:hypothetical protein
VLPPLGSVVYVSILIWVCVLNPLLATHHLISQTLLRLLVSWSRAYC